MQLRYPQTQIISTVINDVVNYMDVNNFNMGDNVYLGDLFKEINNVSGVLNVIDLRVYNMVGGNYSLNEISHILHHTYTLIIAKG